MNNNANGGTWDELQEKISTPKEIAAREGLEPKKLEALSGVKQPIIARMERGSSIPQLDTVLKVLAPLGKTLAIVPLNKTK